MERYIIRPGGTHAITESFFWLHHILFHTYHNTLHSSYCIHPLFSFYYNIIIEELCHEQQLDIF